MAAQEHILTMENRAKLSISGVEEVVSFSQNDVCLQTVMGAMKIHGTDLNVSKLDTALGKLDVDGEISSVAYTDIKKRKGMFEGLFG